MTKRVTWGIYSVEGEDEQYAILPDDGTQGLLVGDYWSLINLSNAIDNNLDAALSTIPRDHEQLGFEWTTIYWVNRVYGIPETTLKSACQEDRIKGAKKNRRGDWTFSRLAFRSWLAKHKEETRGKR